MVARSTFLQLALLPVLALSSPVIARGEESGFNYDSLDLREVGARNTLDWRMWLEKNGQPISFWHDIPLYPNKKNNRVVSFVVEIPRWTDGIVELRRDEPLNPIFHEAKESLPRFMESIWPHKSYPFHYGSIPQTWESPNFDHDFTERPGDNGPIDLFDISGNSAYIGQVKHVKILGGIALNHGREADWKVIGIDINDPLAALVEDVSDLDKYRPGLSSDFYDWFHHQKVPGGEFITEVIDGKYQKAKFVAKTVEKSHEFWGDLLRGTVHSTGINYNQTNNRELKESYVNSKNATQRFSIPKRSKILPAAERPAKYDSWYYLNEDHELIQV
ncbi:inorganic pyrophosphatase [Dactylonectria estremocensis]|uniref:inorganic diphosphatase n=1 Tax=Dactylonectria estremocensis TaxID=1079267 RepID=A0A9P9J890_9HYPO|nr:inorganic pyrophosphatase [Dactylonectria estremocensis]